MEIAWKQPYTSTPGYIIADYLIEILFMFDIVIKFRTTFLNKQGEEETNKKEIAIHYMFSLNFLLDVLTIS